MLKICPGVYPVSAATPPAHHPPTRGSLARTPRTMPPPWDAPSSPATGSPAEMIWHIRVDEDRAYVHVLRDAHVPRDPRVGPSATYGKDWLPAAHARQLRHLAEEASATGRPDRDRLTPAGDTPCSARIGEARPSTWHRPTARLAWSTVSARRSGCHAEGRGFESLHPLSRNPRSGRGMVVKTSPRLDGISIAAPIACTQPKNRA